MMKKVKFNDWDELLVKSQNTALNLNNLNGSLLGNTTLRRGICELEREYDLPAVYPTFLPDSQKESKAVVTNVASFVEQHHDFITFQTISEAKKSSESEFRNLQNKWSLDEWNKSKQKFLEGLGLKAVNPSFQQLPATAPIAPIQPTAVSQPKSYNMLTANMNAVSKIATAYQLESKSVRPCVELLSALNDVNDKNANELVQYKTLLEVFMTLSHEDQAMPSSPGHYARVSYPVDNEIYMLSKSKIPDNLIAKSELSFQFRRFLQSQISSIWYKKFLSLNLTPSPVTDLKNSSCQFLKALVKHLFRVKIFPASSEVVRLSTRDDYLPIWAYFFYCLRSGHLLGMLADIDLLIGHVTPMESELISTILGIWIKLENNDLSTLGGDDLHKLKQALKHGREWYRRESNSTREHKDEYKLLVLNLLFIVDRNHLLESDIMATTVEDFLWFNLWFEYFEFHSLDVHNTASLDYITSANTTFNQMYEYVLSFGGAKHFDNTGKSPYLYVLTLLACQKYGEAIIYLWQSMHALEAVHLMIICMFYGLILPFAPLYSKNSTAVVSVDEMFSDLTPAAILQAYLSSNANVINSSTAVDYLSTLMITNWRNDVIVNNVSFKARYIVAQAYQQLILTLNSTQLNEIVSKKKDSDVIPRLHMYFSVDETRDMIYKAAAEKLARKDFYGAVFLFEISNHLIEALREINSQLEKSLAARDFVTDDAKQTNSSWKTVAVDFYERHFSIANSPLLSQLNQSNLLILYRSLEVLLKASTFFDLADSKRFDDALNILIDIGMLPMSMSEVEGTDWLFIFNQFSIGCVLDDVYLRALECLRNQINFLRTTKLSKQFAGVITDVDVRLDRYYQQCNAVNYLSKKLADKFKRRDTVRTIQDLTVNVM